jgi:hypothetical protein
MKAERYLAEDAAIKKGVDMLVKELGPVEAMRFINFPRERREESLKRHRAWQKTLNKERFFDEVFK